ncbi:MAG TPA: 50S ribosomal protein L10 [Candidatus Parcubacteria bacterium]|jgi:large subunit ribosomal protein L10|nr:50S ribosomal protein L10 [Parcubacteria group bacterium]HJN62437.1 50S ribosomal protein L10 [Candidatus Parcubacteria bacterium]|tara:strand:- start:312 stop:833 length:522 start_codon:yes stop_codon:yes gene_type:complete
MPLTKEQKRKAIDKLKENIDKQKIVFFVDFRGLKVKDLSELRKKLKKINSNFIVAKKTLLKLAFKDKGISIDPKKLDGEIAVIFGFGDEIMPAKTAYEFSQDKGNLQLLGGYIESKKNEFLNSIQLIELAKLPTREELLAKITGSLAAPLSGTVNVLQGNIKGLVYALSAIKK